MKFITPGLVVCLLFFTGCSKDIAGKNNSTDASPAYDDSFIESSIGDASYLNPVLVSDNASGAIAGMVFNGLVKYGPDLKLIGDLAERWEISKDGLVFTFHLRKNVLWHDGKPFTAEDVLYTYERLMDPEVKTPHASNYDKVKSVTAPDPFTVRVTYKEPFVPALESWGMGIVPKHVFGDAKGKDFNSHAANKKPVGTGPYRFKEWKVDEKIVLEANPDYYDGRPHVARYIFRIIPDKAVEFLELRNQSIDSMALTPDQSLAYDSFFTNYERYRHPAALYTYLAFNLDTPLFKDKKIREAVAHAVNKKDIVQGVLLGMGQNATGPFLPLSWAFDPEVPDFDYDPELSKKILAEAGWKTVNKNGVLEKDGKPLEFTILMNQGNKMRALSGEIIQQQLAKIGIKANLRVVEWSALIKNFVDEHKFEALIMGWSLTPDPDQYSIWHSSQKEKGQYNFVGYNNPEVDRLLEEGRKTFNLEKRTAIYRKIHRLIHDDLPYLFLYYPDALPVVHKRFEGVSVQPISSFGFGWNFDKWFVEKRNVKYPVLAP